MSLNQDFHSYLWIGIKSRPINSNSSNKITRTAIPIEQGFESKNKQNSSHTAHTERLKP